MGVGVVQPPYRIAIVLSRVSTRRVSRVLVVRGVSRGILILPLPMHQETQKPIHVEAVVHGQRPPREALSRVVGAAYATMITLHVKLCTFTVEDSQWVRLTYMG